MTSTAVLLCWSPKFVWLQGGTALWPLLSPAFLTPRRFYCVSASDSSQRSSRQCGSAVCLRPTPAFLTTVWFPLLISWLTSWKMPLQSMDLSREPRFTITATAKRICSLTYFWRLRATMNGEKSRRTLKQEAEQEKMSAPAKLYLMQSFLCEYQHTIWTPTQHVDISSTFNSGSGLQHCNSDSCLQFFMIVVIDFKLMMTWFTNTALKNEDNIFNNLHC